MPWQTNQVAALIVSACVLLYAAANAASSVPSFAAPAADAAPPRTPLVRAAAGPPAARSAMSPDELADALQAFGAELLGQLTADAKPGSNVFISPLSIASALAMAGAGATPDSAVAASFATVLHADLSGGGGAAALRALAHNASAEPGVTLSVANALWARAGVRAEYAAAVAADFDASAAPLPSSAAPVNDWVAAATQGHITRIVDDGVVADPLTLALLVNAVFFKAPWAAPFEPARTAPGVFRAHAASAEADAPAEELKCSMMSHKPRQTLFARTEDATAVALPYAAGRFRALLVLPSSAEPRALAALGAAPGGAALRALRAGLSERRVALQLPRFQLDYGVASLKPALQALGLGPAFGASAAADGPAGGFSRMSDDAGTHLSDVLHKAVLEVTEEGTVAAAATAAVMSVRSVQIQPPPEVVVFDRPFLIVIEDAATGAPLFLGTVVRPRFT